MTDTGGVRPTDPQTSHDAAASVRATAMENAVYFAIKGRGARGATWHEIHLITGIALASISPRLKPLREKRGLIESRLNLDNKVIKRPGPSGCGQIVWYAKRRALPDDPWQDDPWECEPSPLSGP